MIDFECPEDVCPFHKKIEKVDERFVLWHFRTKPRSTLISLVMKLGLNANPFQESNEVLRKLLLNASIVGDDNQ